MGRRVGDTVVGEDFKTKYERTLQEERDISKPLNQRRLIESLNQAGQLSAPPIQPQGPGVAPTDAFPDLSQDPNVPPPYSETGLPVWVRVNANTKPKPIASMPDVIPPKSPQAPDSPPKAAPPKPAAFGKKAPPPPGMPLGVTNPQMALKATAFGKPPQTFRGGAKPSAPVANSYTYPAPTAVPVAKPPIPYV